MFQRLAMGFNWAVYFCQRASEGLVTKAWLDAELLLRDRNETPLLDLVPYLIAACVDGVAVISASEEE